MNLQIQTSTESMLRTFDIVNDGSWNAIIIKKRGTMLTLVPFEKSNFRLITWFKIFLLKIKLLPGNIVEKLDTWIKVNGIYICICDWEWYDKNKDRVENEFKHQTECRLFKLRAGEKIYFAKYPFKKNCFGLLELMNK